MLFDCNSSISLNSINLVKLLSCLSFICTFLLWRPTSSWGIVDPRGYLTPRRSPQRTASLTTNGAQRLLTFHNLILVHPRVNWSFKIQLCSPTLTKPPDSSPSSRLKKEQQFQDWYNILHRNSS